MPLVVGIRFKTAGKIFYFDAAGYDLPKNSFAVVETGHGKEVGRVVIPAIFMEDIQTTEPLRPVIRIADDQDLTKMDNYKLRNEDAQQRCTVRINAHQLPMKLIRAEYAFDGSRLTFYFTAEGRVDFRNLVRDLASIFRTRIELRQIGVRDAAKMQGGVGRCGRTLCCSSWLPDFPTVSIKMAKEQDLSLNPAKISGVCGRLLCCLSYENDTYIDMKKQLPRIGDDVETPEGPGRITSINVIKESVVVELERGAYLEFPASDVKRKMNGKNFTVNSVDELPVAETGETGCSSCTTSHAAKPALIQPHRFSDPDRLNRESVVVADSDELTGDEELDATLRKLHD